VYKRVLTWPLTLVVLQGLGTLYRAFVLAAVLRRIDPRLREFLQGSEPAIFAAWHQDFALAFGWLSRTGRRRPLYALASASRDGGIATALARAVGFRGLVRGSSARGGTRALLGLHRLLRLRADASLGVVCDGPRPPARVLKPGILHLARETGRPIWLLCVGMSPRIELARSWARFRFPRPTTRAVVLGEGPIRVAPDLDREGLEAVRAGLEARFRALGERADLLARQDREGRPGGSGS